MNDSVRKIDISSATSRVEPQKEELPQTLPSFGETDSSLRWQLIFLHILKRELLLFPKEMSEDSSIFLRKSLKKLKNSLQLLTDQDLSQDAAFLLQLSHHWNQLLEYFSPLHMGTSREEKKLQEFITEIYDYPSGENFSLGYYLSEAAGEKWTPFPFMNLLHDLYQEHHRDPTNSHLFLWLSLLEHLLE